MKIKMIKMEEMAREIQEKNEAWRKEKHEMEEKRSKAIWRDSRQRIHLDSENLSKQMNLNHQ